MMAQHQTEQQRATNNSEAWCRWVDQPINQHLEQQFDLLRDAIGKVISNERAARRKEV
jgi:hypothetical protein